MNCTDAPFDFSDFLLFMPHTHDGPALEAALSFYSSIVTVSAEGDSLVSEDTLEGLGTTGFLLQALFGSLLKLANPGSVYNRQAPASPVSTAEASQSFPSQSSPGQEITEPADMAASVAPARYAISAATVGPQQIIADAVGGRTQVSLGGEEHSQDISDLQGEVEEIVKTRLTDLLPEPGYFLAGAVSGGVSRTATAPLDRLKVYLLVNTKPPSTAALPTAKQGLPLTALRNAGGPILDAVVRLWKTGGLRTFFAGRANNSLGISPCVTPGIC